MLSLVMAQPRPCPPCKQMWQRLYREKKGYKSGKRGSRSRIRLIEGNAKSPRLKSNLEKDLAAAVYLSQAPSPPNIFLWVVKQFCRH
jgi:hypothetical protein